MHRWDHMVFISSYIWNLITFLLPDCGKSFFFFFRSLSLSLSLSCIYGRLILIYTGLLFIPLLLMLGSTTSVACSWDGRMWRICRPKAWEQFCEDWDAVNDWSSCCMRSTCSFQASSHGPGTKHYDISVAAVSSGLRIFLQANRSSPQQSRH